MNSYRLTFTVNGKRTETVVYANTLTDAKRMIAAQYSGSKVNFISTGHEYK